MQVELCPLYGCGDTSGLNNLVRGGQCENPGMRSFREPSRWVVLGLAANDANCHY